MQVKGKFENLGESQKKVLEMADSVGLSGTNGAAGYKDQDPDAQLVKDGGKLTWHFDAKIDVSEMYYTIKYVDQNGNPLKDESGKVWAPHGTVINKEDIEKPAITGYEFDSCPDSITINKGATNVFTLTYRPIDVDYKVEFYYKENGQYPATATDSVARKGLTASTAKVTEKDKTPKAGYVFDTDAVNVLESEINADGTTVLKLYFKPVTDKSYTVHYYRTDTTESLVDDKVESGKTFGETYKETAISVDGYEPDASEKSIKIGLDKNEITFYYTAKEARIRFETNSGTPIEDMVGVTNQEIEDQT